MATDVLVTRIESEKTVGDIPPGDLFTADGLLWMRGTPHGTGNVKLQDDISHALGSVQGSTAWCPVVCMHRPYVGQVSLMDSRVPVEPVAKTEIRVTTAAEVKPMPFLPDPE